MLRLADIALQGRRVLAIEADFDAAAEMASEIRHSGGVVVGAVPSLASALAVIDTGVTVDCAMIDTRMADCGKGFDLLRRRGVGLVFVTGFDDWFELEDDSYSVSSVRVANARFNG